MFQSLIPKGDLLKLIFALVLAFLLLTHYTGFSADVKAGFSGLSGFTRVLQGR
jgi:hypothetical protein